jgi:hypothetical protein
MNTRYLICGGRDFDDWAMLDRALSALILHPKAAVIIHGAAHGADTLAAAWGKERKAAEVIPVPADWKAHGNAAGPIRNRRMLDEFRPDVVIAFPGGRGTADMVKQARARQLVTVEVVA